MGVNSFFLVLLSALAGFVFSVCAEFVLEPRPAFRRPISVWIAQLGLWLIPFSLAMQLLGRPVCALAATLAIYIIIFLVSNAKNASLREPFLFQDYDYFLDTIRFPRLFLPFLGLKSFLLCALGVLVAIAGFILEPPLSQWWAWPGVPTACGLLFMTGLSCIVLSHRHIQAPTLVPARDYNNLGLPVFILVYGLKSRAHPRAISPFAGKTLRGNELPHLVAVQSESFFDPRPLFRGLAPKILSNLDLCMEEGFAHGSLQVPAWGANTVRSEFSFLTGIPAKDMGIHRFNPYQVIIRGWLPQTLPLWLKSLGYHTVCVHPYHPSFYGRKKIFPAIGFDKFIDMEDFRDSSHVGAYIGDMAVAQKIGRIIGHAEGKSVFIFAITMENHGPLQMEKKADKHELAEYFESLPPETCWELGIYARHLNNANNMIGMIRETCIHSRDHISFCFYGDHVPIMPEFYRNHGLPDGQVPYFCWDNRSKIKNEARNINISALAPLWLKNYSLF